MCGLTQKECKNVQGYLSKTHGIVHLPRSSQCCFESFHRTSLSILCQVDTACRRALVRTYAAHIVKDEEYLLSIILQFVSVLHH